MTRVTLREVAEASGVSQSTVSFVLNDRPGVSISDATRARVLDTARELGYKPHGIARALREGTSRVVVLNIQPGLDSNYLRSYIRGLEEELAARGFMLLVRFGKESAETDHAVFEAIVPRAVLRFGDAYLRGGDLDDYGGGAEDGLVAHTELQLRYLIDQGHTAIALAVSDEPSLVVKVRLQFARRAASSLGLQELPEIAISRARPQAAPAMGAFRGRFPAVSAIAALDDGTALCVLAALQDNGDAVPEDVAVIGYDDIGYGALTTPPLTTVSIDGEAHGRRAALRALDLDATKIEYTPGRVLVRGSA